MLQWIGFVIIGSGILIDVASFALGLRRLRQGGPSGVPLVGYALVVVGVVLLLGSGQLDQQGMTRWLIGYGIVHFVLQFGLLAVIYLLLSLFRRS